MKRALLIHCRRCYSTTKPFRFVSGVATLPDPTKESNKGEDSLFVSEKTIGVADGVGAWADEGVDAGEYSRQLMNHAAAIVSETSIQKSSYSTMAFSPVNILSSAFTKVEAVGSSTACIIQINGNKLHAANLGDSGFRICRDLNSKKVRSQESRWNILYKSTDQLHGFNCPLQLGHDSDDKPSDASVISFNVIPGDIVVAATDGLFDNLYDREIIRLISLHYDENREDSIQRLAEQLAAAAQKVAKCKTTETPFALAARRAGHSWVGGKLDDITVITSLVVA